MRSRDQFDVLIIGGGTAGLSASLWCAELGLNALLCEKEQELGGQLLWTYNAISNHLGTEAKDGLDLRDKFVRHHSQVAGQREVAGRVNNTDLTNKLITLNDGRTVSGRAIIIATGVRRRQLGVPGERDFIDRGVLTSGVKDKARVRGRSVLVVGGGDAAFENALILSEFADKVFVVHRRSTPTARQICTRAAALNQRIEILGETIVTEICGVEDVNGVQIRNVRSGNNSHMPVQNVLIRIGVEPNTEMFAGQIRLDGAGYVVVDSRGATSVEFAYAIGDVAHPLSPTISQAVGTGAAAVKAIKSALDGVI